jgi:hypothetical protein
MIGRVVLCSVGPTPVRLGIAATQADRRKSTAGGIRRTRCPTAGSAWPSQALHIVEPVRPEALLRRLLDGSVTNVAFVDAERLLRALGFEELRVKGSHHVYGRPGIAQQLNLQEIGGQAKPYQLRQLMALVRRYHLSIEEDR